MLADADGPSPACENTTVATLRHRDLDHAGEVRRYPGGHTEIFELDDFVIGRMVMEPGWRWSTDVQPIAETERCMYHHLGFVISVRLRVVLDDGTEDELGPGAMSSRALTGIAKSSPSPTRLRASRGPHRSGVTPGLEVELLEVHPRHVLPRR